MTRPGFTLLELLVVLTVVALAAAAVVPMVGRGDGPGGFVPEEVDRLGATMARARAHAALRGHMVRFSVHLDGSYETHVLARDGPAIIEQGMAPDGNDWVVASATFVFGPTGVARADTLRVRAGESTWLLTADPWNGAARIERIE